MIDLPEKLAAAWELKTSVSPETFAQALGLNHAPVYFLLALQSFPDDLPMPEAIPWTREGLTSRYTEPYQALETEVKDEIQTLATTAYSSEWLERIQALQAEHPEVPVLYNLELGYYRAQADFDHWESKAKATLERFPRYIFATCSLASLYLYTHRPEELQKLFEGNFEIHQFTGEKRIYEHTEMSSFYSVMAWYHLVCLRLLRAAFCYALVRDIAPATPFLENLVKLFAKLPENLLLDLAAVLKTSRENTPQDWLAEMNLQGNSVEAKSQEESAGD